MGCTELGFISMREIRELRGPLGLPVERDLHFDADKTLSAYAAEARQHGRIVTSPSCQAVRASVPSPGDGESVATSV
jgi:hypothetical protein